MGLGDLRHQEDGQTPQQPEGKGQQGQGHPFQVSVLGHSLGAPAGALQIDRKAGRDQHILGGVEGTGETSPALHRPEDVPEPPPRVMGTLYRL